MKVRHVRVSGIKKLILIDLVKSLQSRHSSQAKQGPVICSSMSKLILYSIDHLHIHERERERGGIGNEKQYHLIFSILMFNSLKSDLYFNCIFAIYTSIEQENNHFNYTEVTKGIFILPLISD